MKNANYFESFFHRGNITVLHMGREMRICVFRDMQEVWSQTSRNVSGVASDQVLYI